MRASTLSAQPIDQNLLHDVGRHGRVASGSNLRLPICDQEGRRATKPATRYPHGTTRGHRTNLDHRMRAEPVSEALDPPTSSKSAATGGLLAGMVAGTDQPDHVRDLAFQRRGKHLRGQQQRQLVRLRFHPRRRHRLLRTKRAHWHRLKALTDPPLDHQTPCEPSTVTTAPRSIRHGTMLTPPWSRLWLRSGHLITVAS